MEPSTNDDDDSLLNRLLESMGVEEIGTFDLYHDICDDGMWQVVIEEKDGTPHDLPKKFVSPGNALDYINTWASSRGLILAIGGGKIRRYKDSVEGRLAMELKDYGLS